MGNRFLLYKLRKSEIIYTNSHVEIIVESAVVLTSSFSRLLPCADDCVVVSINRPSKEEMCSCPGLNCAMQIVMLALTIGTIRFYVNNKTSFFLSSREIKSLSEKYAKISPFKDQQTQLSADLERIYSGHIVQNSEEWLVSLGGALVKMRFVYHSMTEYLALINAPVATTGHTGIHWMNQSCSVLSGSVQRFKVESDGKPQRDVESFDAGRHFRWSMFEPSVISMNNGTWLLCQGRGFVPASVPYLAANIFSTGDFKTLVSMFWIEGKSMAYESFRGFPLPFLSREQ